MAKGGQAFFFTSLDTAGIRETPMDLIARMRKVRTRFCCLIADGHDQIHRRLIMKFLQAFGTVMADVNADFLHDFDGQRMDHTWLSSCTKDRIENPSSCAEQTLGHLRARGVM